MASSQIVLISQPRTACHLLERILISQQQNVKTLAHPSQAAVPVLSRWHMSESWKSGMPENEQLEYEAAVQDGNSRWQNELSQAQQEGLIFYVHTHPFYTLSPSKLTQYVSTPESAKAIGDPQNQTLIPDDLLLRPGTVPIFTVRHPVLFVPSLIRALDSTTPGGTRATYLIGSSLQFSRELYDWYNSRGVEPIVAEADDYMTSEDYCRRLAQAAGLDPSRIAFKWSETSEQQRSEMHPILLKIQQRLVESEGPEAKRAASNVDLDAERRKWDSEFSKDIVSLIKELVDLAMPHYEYLRSRRFV